MKTTDPNEKIKARMREAFEEELDFEASCVFAELSEVERDRIIGIADDQDWGDYDDAERRGRDYADSLTDADKTAAIRRHYIKGGASCGYWDGKQLPGVYDEWLPADIVDRYDLQDVIIERGWVRHKDGYYSQEAISRLESQAAQEEADARDLFIGRNFGAKLDDIKAIVAASKAQGVETRQGVGVLVQHLPDAKKTPIISWAEAAEHFMPGVFLKRGDEYVRPAEERGKAVDSFRKTCSNWLKAGVAGRSGLPISRDNLATVGRWDKWIEAYRIAERKANIVSERAGKVEKDMSRRRSPTA